MTELQHRINFRELSIVLGIIGCMIAFEYGYYWMSGIFVAYLMWNSFRLVTHVSNKWKKKP